MTTYDLCKRVITNKTYSTKEDMQFRLDVFFAAGRITQGEYEELTGTLNE